MSHVVGAAIERVRLGSELVVVEVHGHGGGGHLFDPSTTESPEGDIHRRFVTSGPDPTLASSRSRL